MSAIIKNYYESPFPAMNAHQRDGPVANHTIYCDTPGIDDGSICAHLFVGIKSPVSGLYGTKTDNNFVNSLEGNIHTWGYISKLINDSDQYEVIKFTQSIIWDLFIDYWQNEPHYQHMKFSERHYQTTKHLTNTILDTMGDTYYTWLLSLVYVLFLLNHTCDSEIMVYQSPRHQYLQRTLSQCCVFAFGKQSITSLVNLISCQIALKNVIYRFVLHNMLGMIRPLRSLMITIRRTYSVPTFDMLEKPYNTTFYLTIFVGCHIPLSIFALTGVNKVCPVLILILNQYWFRERIKMMKICLWIETFPKIKMMEKWGD